MSDADRFEDWKQEEKRHKLIVAAWVFGGLAALGVAFAIWAVLFRVEKLPMVCEAALQKVERVCKVDRRKAVALIKHSKPLVDKDANRRETCRVLASTDHEFWRAKAIKAMLEKAKHHQGGKALPKIPSQGMLTQEASDFVDKELIVPFIRKTYCSKQK